MSRTFNQRDKGATSSLASTAPYMNLEQDYSLPTDIERELQANHARSKPDFRITKRSGMQSAKSKPAVEAPPVSFKENIQGNSRLMAKRQELLELQQR